MLESYNDLVKLWGCPITTESLTCGISSEDINLPSCSSAGTSSNFKNDTNKLDEDNNDKNIELTNLSKKEKQKSTNPIPQLANNKRKHLERQLGLAQRD